MPAYFRVMSGARSIHTPLCVEGGFTGTDYLIQTDLTDDLELTVEEFATKHTRIYLQENPDRSKIADRLACSATWTVSKRMQTGDVVVTPDGTGNLCVGVVSGAYFLAPNEPLFHRRPVTWNPERLPLATLTTPLRKSLMSLQGVISLAAHATELTRVLSERGGARADVLGPFDHSPDDDPATFALERHLEDFLVENWARTPLGRTHDLLAEDGNLVGRQYPAGDSIIDLLAVRKDRSELLVIELKRRRATDTAVGQLLRYMGWVKANIADEGQSVAGMIIASEDDPKLRLAMSVVPNVGFLRYEVSFTLRE